MRVKHLKNVTLMCGVLQSVEHEWEMKGSRILEQRGRWMRFVCKQWKTMHSPVRGRALFHRLCEEFWHLDRLHVGNRDPHPPVIRKGIVSSWSYILCEAGGSVKSQEENLSLSVFPPPSSSSSISHPIALSVSPSLSALFPSLCLAKLIRVWLMVC